MGKKKPKRKNAALAKEAPPLVAPQINQADKLNLNFLLQPIKPLLALKEQKDKLKYIPPKRHESLIYFIVWISIAPIVQTFEMVGLLIFYIYFWLEKHIETLMNIRQEIFKPLLSLIVDLMLDCFHMIVVPFCQVCLKPYIKPKEEYDGPDFGIRFIKITFEPLCKQYKSLHWLQAVADEAYYLCFEQDIEEKMPTPRELAHPHDARKQNVP